MCLRIQSVMQEEAKARVEAESGCSTLCRATRLDAAGSSTVRFVVSIHIIDPLSGMLRRRLTLLSVDVVYEMRSIVNNKP